MKAAGVLYGALAVAAAVPAHPRIRGLQRRPSAAIGRLHDGRGGRAHGCGDTTGVPGDADAAGESGDSPGD